MSSIDEKWIMTTAAAAQGVRVEPAQAEEFARNIRTLLDALDAISGHLRFSDEPSAFVPVLARHKQREA